MSTIINLSGLSLITVVAAIHFGVLEGMAIGAAVYLLMPWAPRK